MPPSDPSPTPGGWEPPSAFELDAVLPVQYKVISLLGSDGMGALYHATQSDPGRDVAIRVLPLRETAGLDAAASRLTERFKLDPGSIARRIQPGTPPVYDSGETDDGLLYIVMEYANGIDIAGEAVPMKPGAQATPAATSSSGPKNWRPAFLAAVVLSAITLLALLAWLFL